MRSVMLLDANLLGGGLIGRGDRRLLSGCQRSLMERMGELVRRRRVAGGVTGTRR